MQDNTRRMADGCWPKDRPTAGANSQRGGPYTLFTHLQSSTITVPYCNLDSRSLLGYLSHTKALVLTSVVF